MNKTAPVLLIFFNRPDTLRLVFEEIKKAKPQKLYLCQDGARKDHPEDEENIKKCREIVENIDWECKVLTNYSTKNNGCGKGPQRAIDWFFENEEEGIIVEDDCVASQSFFSFCTEMLDRYRDDERIFLISGCNLELQSVNIKESYFFGYAGTNWGWATWKRNWIKMDYACSWVKNKKLCKDVKKIIASINKRAAIHEMTYFKITNKLVSNNVDISYWDVQFQAIRYINKQLSIIPQKNLITNIGLGPMSTHAKYDKTPSIEHSKIGEINYCYNKRFELEKHLTHPKMINENIDYDKKVYSTTYPPVIIKVVNKLLQILKLK